MHRILLLTGYSIAIAAASFAGGWLPSRMRLSHARMQVLVSFVAGLMLGVSLFHMLPHAAMEMKSLDLATLGTTAGLLSMFFLIRAFHFHQHGSAETHAPGEPTLEIVHHHEHDHDHDNPGAECGHAHASEPPRNMLGWVGVAFGLTLHSFFDGVALAAGVEAGHAHVGTSLSWLVGFETFLAICLHKPLDAMSITSLMSAGGWSASWQRTVNVCFALISPLGAALFYLGASHMGPSQHLFVGGTLAFSAGIFLCISLADLLPELQFHAHDRLKLSVALLFGVLVAYGIHWLEPAHVHTHTSPVPAASAPLIP